MKRTNEEFGIPLRTVFAESLEFGDAATIAKVLRLNNGRVHEWIEGSARSPFETCAVITETLRRNRNPKANNPLLALAHRLGCAVVPLHPTEIEDQDFADVLREFSDVVSARAEAERDGRIEPEERIRIAGEVAQLIDRAAAYRLHQLELAKDEQAKAIVSMPVGMRGVA